VQEEGELSARGRDSEGRRHEPRADPTDRVAIPLVSCLGFFPG